MKRLRWGIGILAVVVAAGVAHAAVPSEVTLFGQKYQVTAQSRGGTFKNGVKITLQTEGDGVGTTKKANLCFAEGADASSDRLFVVAPIGADTDGPTGDQFYVLTGTDENGVFSTSHASATQFFGGVVDRNRGGRGQTVAWLSDTRTGPKKDRNVVLCTFTGADRVQFYDLDTLNAGFEDDSVLSIGLGEDDNMPSGAWDAFARAPNGLLVVAAGTEVSLMDPTKDQFFAVKTDLLEATQNSAIKLDGLDGASVHGLARAGEDEYWLLASTGNPGGDNDNTDEQYLFRLKLTLPANPASAGSIKVEVLGREELIAKNLHGSPGGMFGVAVGREASPGKRRVYFSDWVGNLITLSPVQ
jgi:hypothetical protein